MNKLGLFKKKSQNTNSLPVDDIPEAVRDDYEESKQQPIQTHKKLQIWKFIGIGALALIIAIWLHFLFNQTQATAFVSQLKKYVGLEVVKPSPTSTSITPSPSASPTPTSPSIEQKENILGHLPYEEASWQELQPVFGNQNVRLRPGAAKQFNAMSEAAWAAGINLVPISGFRTLADQEYLFFEVKANRGQVASQRAEVSAPPGYSEHHTGYAIDIGDATAPGNHLKVNFENTRAFQWLQENAGNYGFELSFPRNNPQGISYEPWHWRFVGDNHSGETFDQARSLKKLQPTENQELTMPEN
ncbi:MAG: D-alanyl-D-alanine carboxypeptidase family protein [Microcoleaceae cyanobacterium MO_207.B10]|nr:D-alanyl-D-alanine carboxypeptidase family protein [Microcoleaceae cyanobacterium MO_207.B10]